MHPWYVRSHTPLMATLYTSKPSSTIRFCWGRGVLCQTNINYPFHTSVLTTASHLYRFVILEASIGPRFVVIIQQRPQTLNAIMVRSNVRRAELNAPHTNYNTEKHLTCCLNKVPSPKNLICDSVLIERAFGSNSSAHWLSKVPVSWLICITMSGCRCRGVGRVGVMQVYWTSATLNPALYSSDSFNFYHTLWFYFKGKNIGTSTDAGDTFLRAKKENGLL